MATRPQSVNERIHDLTILHAVQIERLKNAEQQKVATFVQDDLLPAMIKKLDKRMARIEERGLDIGPATTARLRRMIVELQTMLEQWTTGFSKDLFDRIAKIAVFEGQWAIAVMSENVGQLPLTLETDVPAADQMAMLIDRRPVDGVLIQSMVGRLTETAKFNLDRAIRIGIAGGETNGQIAARVREATNFSRDSAMGLTRTAVQHAAQIGRDAMYEANADIIKGIQWVATLDTRTCKRCGPIDGKVYQLNQGPRPPLHINCRCTTVPVLKSWRQIGLKVNDVPEATRASMNGQVPESLKFADWVKRLSPAEQDEVLGRSRGDLLRKGGLQVGDFVNRQNEVITLDDLRRRHADAFSRAGL